ncbi:hypothetical protein SAMN05660420_01477 [Desulfuromusa kysingii]|uniref:Uncharacterized protein n=1 Tax=Desulfuromusa kysingii TaxID=37625 RepID=A0A1H3Z0K5_9BACT|nr:tetratricopeptide repeat protein [Desulfuromusa kysingii]SEA17373.1 hypothetical protein SAMN05660420_01477 [Desulfuromusa kysingii]
MTRLLIVILCAITLLLPQTAFAKSNIDKARDYAKIEKTSEARQLLNQAILDDPLDADVHYEAGLVYSQLGMTSDFDLAMKNACKLKPSYCPKVAEPYYNMGFNLLEQRNDTYAASRAFEMAFAYAPSRKPSAVSRIYNHYLVVANYHVSKQDYSSVFNAVADGMKFGQSSKDFETVILQVLRENKGNKHFDDYRERAIKLLGEEVVSKDFPPKSWKVVHTEEHIGIGWDDNDSKKYHVLFNYPNAYNQKQTIKCTGKFKVWRGSVLKWVEYDKERIFIIDNPNVKGNPGVEIQEGERLIYIAEEFK